MMSPEHLAIVVFGILWFAALCLVIGLIEEHRERRRADFTAHRWPKDSARNGGSLSTSR